jgi:hypothetical protein
VGLESFVNGNECSVEEDSYLQKAIDYLSNNAVEDDNSIALYSPTGPGVLAKVAKTGHVGKRGQMSHQGNAASMLPTFPPTLLKLPWTLLNTSL